jgi:hypothetical protein
MSETWTEWGVYWADIDQYSDPYSTREQAQCQANAFPRWLPTVVGRTVTASDWLPVDTDGAL